VNSGETNAIIEQYMTLGSTNARTVTWAKEDAPTADGVSLFGILIKNQLGNTSGTLSSAEDVFLQIRYQLQVPMPELRVGISVYNSDGIAIFLSSDFAADGFENKRQPGILTSTVKLPRNLLLNGRYVAEVRFEIPRTRELITGQSCAFEIDSLDHDGWGPRNSFSVAAAVHPLLEWRVRHDTGPEEH